MKALFDAEDAHGWTIFMLKFGLAPKERVYTKPLGVQAAAGKDSKYSDAIRKDAEGGVTYKVENLLSYRYGAAPNVKKECCDHVQKNAFGRLF